MASATFGGGDLDFLRESIMLYLGLGTFVGIGGGESFCFFFGCKMAALLSDDLE